MTSTLVLGGPGAGKTTRLIEIVERALSAGLSPDRVAFVSFTRAAAYEARDRAIRKFGLIADELPWFRTLHSLCFRLLGLNRGQVFSDRHRIELEELTGKSAVEDAPRMAVSGRSRTTLRSVEEEWSIGTDQHVSHFSFEKFHLEAERYRQARLVYDFTDMLQMYLDGMEGQCPVDLAVVDEAQDLSRLQWLVIEKAFAGCRDVYYAGDDDQSIHRWAGADEEWFHGLGSRTDRCEVLEVSHRLPEPVFDLGQSVVQRISRRYQKTIRSVGKPGILEWIARPDKVDLSTGSWLLLARTRHQLDGLARVARDQGVVHVVAGVPSVDVDDVLAIRAYERLRRGDAVDADSARRALKALGIVGRSVADDVDHTVASLGVECGSIWHDALVGIDLDRREYYLRCLRRGERLDTARVYVETIHGAKGREADNVVLLTETTKRVMDGFRRDEDAERRVWYVGVTRASQVLHVVQSHASRYRYQL